MLQIKKLPSFQDLSVFEKKNIPFFQTPFYLEIFARHFCDVQNVILLGIYEGDELIGYGCFETTQNTGQTRGFVPTSNKIIVGDDLPVVPQLVADKPGGLSLRKNEKIIKFLGMKKVLGGQELTDYGDIYINNNHVETLHATSHDENQIAVEAWEKIIKWFKENGFKKIELDFVRENSETYQILTNKNIRENPLAIRVDQGLQEIASYINLPKDWDTYISQLESHSRHELRRKLNRLENNVGNAHCTFLSAAGGEITKQYFDEFVRLHRLSDQAKEKFMSEKMKDFFWDLINIKNNNWRSVLNFLQINGQNAAAILTFENGIESLAYNSGYDPRFAYYSPGILIHALKIKELTLHGFKKYDFLRGDERYKFDLGAQQKQLFRIEVRC